MAPGEIALQWSFRVDYMNGGAGYGPRGDGIESIGGLVDHQKKYGFNVMARECDSEAYPKVSNPPSHVPVIMRLSDSITGTASSWDYANLWKCSNDEAVWSSKLKVDANGAGTIRGFRLAESGECDVENLPDGQAVRLPLVLEDCTGSVVEWSVKVDGDEKPAYRLGQSNGRLTVIRPGLLLIVR